MTDDELRAYVDVLRRMRERKAFIEEDRLILTRVEKLREEVTSEHQTTPR